LGALTDFLLPGSGSRKNKVSTTNGSTNNKHEGMVHSHVLIMPQR
jgi:endoribonuclease Dicer